MYTEFTSIECAGGTCVCNDPNGLQVQLQPWAWAGFWIYSIGFPVYVFWITWYYRVQIKLDQLLRVHDLGTFIKKWIHQSSIGISKSCTHLCTEGSLYRR